MAGVVTHIALIDKLIDEELADKDQHGLIVGTSFPDIRYLGVTEREKTHVLRPTMMLIRKETNAFRAGMDFHALIDQVRNNYVDEVGLLDKLPRSPLIQTALKLYEDELIYDKVYSWSQYTKCFDQLLPDEKVFGINDQVLNQWHDILQECIVSKPDDGVKRSLLAKIHFPPDRIEDIIQLISELRNNSAAEDFIVSLYDKLEVLIEV